MKKLLFSLIVGLLLCAGLFAQKVKFGVLNGPTCIPSAYLLNEDVQLFADPQALLPKMLKGEIDVGFLPANVAAKVYNSSNGKILCCGITGNGNLSLITTDVSVKQLADLKGKTVAVAGQGATPEYIFRYLLQKNGIKADVKNGVTLDFSIPTPQLAAQLISGKIKYAVVPEPFATVAQMKSDKVLAAVDLQSEYEYFEGKGKIFPLTVLVVTKDFAEKNPEALKAFIAEYEKSFKKTLQNPKEAGDLCEKFGLGLAAPIIAKSVPKANYVFMTSDNPKVKEKVEELLKIFLAFDSTSIGGKLPDENFYCK